MTIFTQSAQTILAPVDAAGNPRPVPLGDFRRWGVEVERLVDTFVSASSFVYDTRAALFADLEPDANALAWVIADPNVGYNGIYRKSGASSTGSWSRIGDLPYSFIRAVNTGTGTVNAIHASASIPIPVTDGGALITLPITSTNTGSPVTVSFNGTAPLTIKAASGHDIAPGGLVAGMVVAGYKAGGEFRLLSDQASTAIQALAQAWAEGTEPGGEGTKSAREWAEESEGFRDEAEGFKDGAEAARDLAAGYVNDIVSEKEVPIFGTTAGLSALNIPVGMTVFRTWGYGATDDDGGARMVEVANDGPLLAGQYQSNSGSRRWEVAETSINVLQLGAEPTNGSASQRTQALQSALDFAAARAVECYLPAGVWIIDDTLRIPSGTRLRGAGIGATTILMADGVGRGVALLQTGALDDPRHNIVIEDMTIDCNRSRWNVTGGDYGVGVLVIYSEQVHLRRLYITGPYNHCIDIASPFPYATGVDAWNAQRSRFVWVEDCVTDDHGDDGIAVHHASDWWIVNCTDLGSGGRNQHNSNGFEIDDGARNGHVINCRAYRSQAGIQIKAHGDGPAPYNIHVTSFMAVNCCNGLQIRHAGVGNRSVSLDLDHTGDAGEYFSPTAYGIVITGLSIIAPKIPDKLYAAGHTTLDVQAIDIQNYSDVLIDNYWISEGAEDIGNKEWEPAQPINGAVISLNVGHRRVTLSNGHLRGFASSTLGLRTTSAGGGSDGRLALRIDGITWADAPANPLLFNSALCDIYIDRYYIVGSHIGSGTTAINFGASASTSPARQHYLGVGRIVGYDNATRWNTVFESGPIMGVPIPIVTGIMDGALMLGVGNTTLASAARGKTAASGAVDGWACRANAVGLRRHFVFEDPNGVIGAITSEAGVMTYGGTSDVRMKRAIGDVAGALDRVCAIKAHTYRRAHVPDDGPIEEGFYAHELQAVFPQAVIGEPNAMEVIGVVRDASGAMIACDVRCPDEQTFVDDDGHEVVGTEFGPGTVWEQTGTRVKPQMVDHSKLVIPLWAALREAAEKIEALADEVASLKAR